MREDLLGDEVTPAIVSSEVPALDAATHTLLLARDSASALEFTQALRADDVLARVVWKKTFPEFGVFQRDKALQDRGIKALEGLQRGDRALRQQSSTRLAP